MKQVKSLESINVDVWKLKKLRKKDTSKQRERLVEKKRPRDLKSSDRMASNVVGSSSFFF